MNRELAFLVLGITRTTGVDFGAKQSVFVCLTVHSSCLVYCCREIARHCTCTHDLLISFHLFRKMIPTLFFVVDRQCVEYAPIDSLEIHPMRQFVRRTAKTLIDRLRIIG